MYLTPQHILGAGALHQVADRKRIGKIGRQKLVILYFENMQSVLQNGNAHDILLEETLHLVRDDDIAVKGDAHIADFGDKREAFVLN